MKKILSIISILIFFQLSSLNAQMLARPALPFNTIFQNGRHLSAYQLLNNPAFLKFDTDEEVLYLRSTVNNANGEFKTFSTPGRTTYIQQSASGKKQVSDSQIFQGSFGFLKEIRHDWDWFVTRDLRFGMPYLLGDSTSGQTHYNGITMQARYSHQFAQNMLIGSELNYYVDEGLKEISPKPTTRHRDILFRGGLGYFLTENLALGAVVNIAGNNEEIYYREDEASVYQETILYKFRGYDLPLVFNKKVETRYAYFDEYTIYGSVAYQEDQRKSIIVYGGGGIQQLELKDNATHPQPEGYWRNTLYQGGLQSYYALSNAWSIGLKYHYDKQSMWAKQPLFDVLISEIAVPEQLFTIGLEHTLSSTIKVGMEADVKLSSIDYHDYYSHINWDVDHTKWKAQIGADVKWNQNISSLISYGYGKLQASKSPFPWDMVSPAAHIRLNDIFYYLTDYVEHDFNLVLEINTKFIGVIRCYGTYRYIKAQNSKIYPDDCRQEFLGTLEFLIKAY